MTTQTEALKLAINRLEWFVDAYPHDITVSKEEFLRPFKEALAQPEQEQEPVAVIGNGFQLLWCREDWSKDLKVGDCLYTSPPHRTAAEGEDYKTWVHATEWQGLTDEEIDEMREANSKGRGAGWRFNFNGFAQAVEAKLKAKNT